MCGVLEPAGGLVRPLPGLPQQAIDWSFLIAQLCSLPAAMCVYEPARVDGAWPLLLYPQHSIGLSCFDRAAVEAACCNGGV